MIPHEDLEQILLSRLESLLPSEQIAELVSEIEQIENEWEEVQVQHRQMGYSMSLNCPDICWLADQIFKGEILKFHRKKKLH